MSLGSEKIDWRKRENLPDFAGGEGMFGGRKLLESFSVPLGLGEAVWRIGLHNHSTSLLFLSNYFYLQGPYLIQLAPFGPPMTRH